MQIPWEAIVAVLIYIIGSTLGFVWWMATQTIKLEFALVALDKISKALTTAEATFATKLELAALTKSTDKNWDEIEKIRDKQNGGNHGH